MQRMKGWRNIKGRDSRKRIDKRECVGGIEEDRTGDDGGSRSYERIG
jgi:hypothetical protein